MFPEDRGTFAFADKLLFNFLVNFRSSNHTKCYSSVGRLVIPHLLLNAHLSISTTSVKLNIIVA